MEMTTNVLASAGIFNATLIAVDEQDVNTYFVSVCESESLALLVGQEPKLRRGQSVVIVASDDFNMVRCDGTIKKLSKAGTRYFVEVEMTSHEVVERRRFLRVKVNMPVNLVTLEEDSTGDAVFNRFSGEFNDLSVGGAWLNTSTNLPIGTVLKWSTETAEDGRLDGLALIVRLDSKNGGMGLEFVDLFADAKFRIERIIERRQAS